MKLKEKLNKIWQSLLEWHCVLEHHLWIYKRAYKQCARCNKKRPNLLQDKCIGDIIREDEETYEE